MNKPDILPEAGADLRQQVDDLVTNLMLGGESCSPELVEALAHISRQAADAGYGEAARVAGELSAAALGLSSAGTAPLQEGLARLQQALADPATSLAAEQPSRAAGGASLAEDPELVSEFVLECREHLTAIEQNLLTLEREPADADAIHTLFRGFHTIKGLAGFLEFAAMQEVAHEVESALNLAREGTLAIAPAVVDVILASVDNLNRAIAQVESSATCSRPPDQDGLLHRIRALKTAGPAEAPVLEAQLYPAAPKTARPAATDSMSLRVDTAKLDYLVDMVGEMVIAQSLVRHHHALATTADPALQRDLAQLSRLTAEVQRTAMAIRMIPIGQLFHRTARQVRDLSRKIGKPVELVLRGEDTELDKTIAEQLADPLMHMVRNALDHGIETPEARQAVGKASEASITLAAYHQAGEIVIEVADDGRGLDAPKILAKARQQGLVEDGAAPLSRADVFRLVLEPGFSTADQVTDISGRGVGMDVVRRQVEKLRGRIDIRSEAGAGTTFLLKLPLTLAIIDGLVVTTGCHRYIVPLSAVREMFRPSAESIFTVQNRREMALVRGRLLPVLRLYRRFGLVPRTEDPCQALLIVAQSGAHSFCLMVDELLGKQEVVIKSLGEGLDKVPGVAGGAILGDGRVGLILDMTGLWRAHEAL